MEQHFSNNCSGEETPIPGANLDLRDPETVIGLFRRAAEANLHDPARKGGSTHLQAAGRLLMSGDLHDNGPNLLRLIKLARLNQSTDHHLILHEIIHGPNFFNGMDLSVQTLARVAALKLDFPAQVHILQANHDLAQFCGVGILKQNTNVIEAFDTGLEYIFNEQADAVREAMFGFIRSYLLAVRCENGLFCCHSLPSPHDMARFDAAVVDRVPTDEDLHKGGSAYRMVWGRNQSQQQADDLAGRWDCKLFLMGHQPAEMGYARQGDTMIILASDHNHGVALPLDLSRPYTMDQIEEDLVMLAGVTV